MSKEFSHGLLWIVGLVIVFGVLRAWLDRPAQGN